MVERIEVKRAVLARKYGKGKAWDRAGLYYLDPPMPQVLRDGGYNYIPWVLVMVQGDTADMYESDANGKLTGVYAKWTPLTWDDGTPRGMYGVDSPSCTGALEAEGYTISTWREVRG